MPYIKTLEPIKPNQKTAGEITLINFINSHPRKAVVRELKSISPSKADVHDPNFNRTIESLTTVYV